MKKLVICLILGIFLISGLASAYNYYPPNQYGRYDDEHPEPPRYYNAYHQPYNYYQPYRSNYYPQATRYYYNTPYYYHQKQYKIEYEYYERTKTEIRQPDGSRFYNEFEKRIRFKRY